MADEQVRSVDAWVEVDDTADTRGKDGKQALRVRGYAVVFDTESERMGSMVETIDRAAFDEVLAADPDVRMLEQHDGTPYARTKSGTLRIMKDQRGLMFEAELDGRSQRARDLYYAIERGDISQMSFGFVIGDEEKRGEKDGVQHWHVTRVARLLEISAVTFPAYAPTSVEADARMDDVDDSDDDSDDDDADVCEECGEAMRECRCGAHRSARWAAERRRLRYG